MSYRQSKESFIPPLWLLTIAAAIGSIWLASQLKELLVLVVLGYFIAYAIDPILDHLEAKGVSRPVGVFAVFGLLVAGLGLLAVTALPTIVSESQRLVSNLGEYVEIAKAKLIPLIEHWKGRMPALFQGELAGEIPEGGESGGAVTSISSLVSYVSGDTVKGIVQAIFSALLGGYSIGLTIVNAALLPFIVYYLAVDLSKIHAFFLALVPITKQRKTIQLFREIDGYVSSFVRGQIVVCSVLFVLYAIALWLIGVDLWLILAAISGFGNIIPYAGFLVGILLSSLMALVTFGDLAHLLWVWAAYSIVQFLEGTFITPKILGESVGLSPLVIILALFAGGQLFGLLGVFLAVPAAAALRVIGRHSYEWVLNKH